MKKVVDSLRIQNSTKLNEEVKKITNQAGILLSERLNAAENGYIVEKPLNKLEHEISYIFNELQDLKGNPINNGKDFEKEPIVRLNYIGQPYTITEITNNGFTVTKLAIYEGYRIDEMKPPSFSENKLIIWIVGRD
jgi:hypothetical protein